jgi:hypothetical protein
MSRSEFPSLVATDIFGTPDMMHTLYACHEQATAYMAFEYAKTTIPISSVQLERTREVSPWGLLIPPAKRNDR